MKIDGENKKNILFLALNRESVSVCWQPKVCWFEIKTTAAGFYTERCVCVCVAEVSDTWYKLFILKTGVWLEKQWIKQVL